MLGGELLFEMFEFESCEGVSLIPVNVRVEIYRNGWWWGVMR